MLRSLLLRTSLRPSQSRSLSTTPLLFAKQPKKSINKLLFPRPPSRRTSKPTGSQDGKTDGPLDSYQLTSQLLRLTSHSRWSDALALLHTSPSRAATTVVWNVLLNSILQNSNAEGTGSIKRAYEVWMDMKKRGIKPSSRSFGTFLGGAAKVARKMEIRGVAKGEGAKEAIGNDVRSKVETVYKQWTVYQSTVRERSNAGGAQELQDNVENLEDLTVHPSNQYISFLSSALSLSRDPQTCTSLLSQILTTFESISPPSTSDPVARNAVTYALTLNALRTALQIANSPSPPPPSFPTTQILLESSLAIFTPLLKSTPLPEGDPLTPQLATSFLSLFLLPSPSVISLSLQSTILDILPRLHGLVPPSELASLAPPVSPSVQQPLASPALDSGALKCVMSLLLKWEKLDWVQGVWEQVNDYPERYFASGKNETEIEHAEIALEAMGRQGDLESAEALLTRLLLEPDSHSPLRPRLKTLETLLNASLRSGKYDSAWRIYQLFSTTSSSSSTSSPSSSDSSSTSIKAPFPPSFKATTSFLLTAVNTRDKTKIWSIIKYLSSPSNLGGGPFSSLFGPEAFPSSTSTSKSEKKTGLRRKDLVIEKIQEKRDSRWQLRYGQAVSRALERILKGREIGLGENEEEIWYAHKRVCGKNPFRWPNLTENELERYADLSTVVKPEAGLPRSWLDQQSDTSGWNGSVEERKVLLKDMLRERLKNAETDPVAMEHLKMVRFQAAQIEHRTNQRADSSRIFDTMIKWQATLFPSDIVARGPSYPWWSRHQHLQVIYHAIMAHFQDKRDSAELTQYVMYATREMGYFYVNEVSIEYRREADRLLKAFGLPRPPGT
ncbi:hypothetical protein JCM3765_004338 [Sporobolomyces pararoseus]